MPENHDPVPNDRVSLPIAAGECPRRYCWYWSTLEFDWELTPKEGCSLPLQTKPAGYLDPDQPCRRAVPGSPADHYEPNDRELEEDKIDPHDWIMFYRDELS